MTDNTALIAAAVEAAADYRAAIMTVIYDRFVRTAEPLSRDQCAALLRRFQIAADYAERELLHPKVSCSRDLVYRLLLLRDAADRGFALIQQHTAQ